MATPLHWIDRLTAPLAPRWTWRRTQARMALGVVQRHYEAAAVGRRTEHWHRGTGDADAVTGPSLAYLRATARDLVRNNPYAESAVSLLANHVVGWGITAKPRPANSRLSEAWKRWADSTACDADGRHDFAGLQKLAMRTVVEAGEVLVRRRWRQLSDGLPLPVQLQVLEPDFLDTSKDGTINGHRVVQGVEYDAIGRRVAYWLYRDHPGSTRWQAGSTILGASTRVPATDVSHVFRSTRPGQTRAPSWFAPVILRLKDLDDYEDATLVKQKVAACLSVLVTDPDGSATALGTAGTDAASVPTDTLQPGGIHNMPPGRTVEIVQPPSVSEHGPYTTSVLRSIASGLKVGYEDVTGDYQQMSFSAARMARIARWPNVEEARWQILIPHFCEPAWRWAMEAAQILGLASDPLPEARWSPPPMPMLEPDKEGLAYLRNRRAGIITLSEAIRERGYDPEELLQEMADENAQLDALGLVLDSDARKMTQAGQAQGAASAGTAPAKAEKDEPDDEASEA